MPTSDADAMGEDAKPGQSSNLAGREDAAVRKAEARYGRDRPRRESPWRRFLRGIRSLGA
jgi:hypothetical protein